MASIVFVAGFAASGANAPVTLQLWPQAAPDEKGTLGQEHDTSTSASGKVAGQSVIRLGDVTTPTFTIYRPPKRKANGTAVLKYRVPKRPGDDAHLLPLEDVQRALSLVRFHAHDWTLDPKRIGVMGFSAGGHLTAHLLATFDQRAYAAADDADQVSCRPDFAMLIYPAYLGDKTKKSQVAPELKVASSIPPVFITQTADDVLGIDGTLAYYLALQHAKVPAEMHMYPTGGHGYGLRPSTNAVSTWPKRAEDWLRTQGLLEKRK